MKCSIGALQTSFEPPPVAHLTKEVGQLFHVFLGGSAQNGSFEAGSDVEKHLIGINIWSQISSVYYFVYDIDVLEL